MSDLVRNESYIGKKYNFVGTKATDLILETIGKVYVKQQNKMTLLDDFIKQIVNKGSNNKSSIMILGPDQSLPLSEYPGDGIIIYDPTTQVLYITYEDDYMMLVDTGGKEIYVKLIGDTMTGQLNIELEDVSKPPFVVNSQALVENLNAQYLNGHTADEFLTTSSSATIAGDWNFNKTLSLSNGLKSKTYQSGCSGIGFYVGSNGDATFNNITVRGKINECNPDTSESEEQEEIIPYITDGPEGEWIIGEYLYLFPGVTIEELEPKFDTETDKYTYTCYELDNGQKVPNDYYLYKQAIIYNEDETESYIELQNEDYKLGEEDENKNLNTMIATIFNGSYVRIIFSDDTPRYFTNPSIDIGYIYKYWRWTDSTRTGAEYYNMICTNIFTDANNTKNYIFKMSNRNLQGDQRFTISCDGTISLSGYFYPVFILMSTQEEVDNWDEESDSSPNPCTILDLPREGDKLWLCGSFSHHESNDTNNRTYVTMQSQGTNTGSIEVKKYPTFTSQSDVMNYPSSLDETGLVFYTGRHYSYLAEGEWKNGNTPYPTYTLSLISENASIRTATTDSLPIPPEGARYTYRDQGYIIDDGEIRHYRRTKSTDCGTYTDGYLNNGIRMTKEGKLGYTGSLEETDPYDSILVNYHNKLIENNEQVKKIPNIETTLNQLVEQMTQVNTNITNINNSINDLNDRIDNIESGTGGDLTNLTEKVNNLETSLNTFKDEYKHTAYHYSSGANIEDNESWTEDGFDYYNLFNGFNIKYGMIPYCKTDETQHHDFYRKFNSKVYCVLVTEIRNSPGDRAFGRVYNATTTGFDYILDNCKGYFVAIGV